MMDRTQGVSKEYDVTTEIREHEIVEQWRLEEFLYNRIPQQP